MAPKILIAEDDSGIRFALSETMSHIGAEVMMAENGQQALELLRQHQVDLVITDFDMPHLDGLKLIEKVREFKPALPTVLMTAMPTIDERTAKAAGATAYLEKPINIDKLISVVEGLLKKK